MDTKNLPSPFYRVALKAIIKDGKDRLLVGLMKGGQWEIPGGGFEHNETIEQCLVREIKEELGSEIESIGKISFIYRGVNVRGYIALRLAINVELKSHEFEFGDLTNAKFVTKDELIQLDMAVDEAPIKDCVDLIWPSTSLKKQG